MFIMTIIFSVNKLLQVFIQISSYWFISVQFSRSVMSDSLEPHGLQHARPPCPSPTPSIYSNSCLKLMSRWCHPTISSSVRQVTHQTSLHRVLGQSVGEEEELVRMVTVSQFSWLFRGSDSWSRLLCPNHIKKKKKNPSLHPVLDLSAFLYR